MTSYIFQLRDLKTYNDESFNATTSLLQLNPEFYTIWNYRREIIENAYGTNRDEELVQILNDELKFVMAQLRKFPKVYWIWNHRRWCLFKLVDLNQVNWEFEFKTVGKMLELDQRNFHGWQYRRFVVENLELEKLKVKKNKENTGGDGGEDDGILRLNLDEFDYTTAKILIDFLNFSAWHNRTKLIPKIYDLVTKDSSITTAIDHPSLHLFQSPLTILNNDLELIKTGIYMSPEDNSVWSYLYWLLSDAFFVHAFNSKEGGNSDTNQLDYKQLLQQQIDLIQEINDLEKEDNGQENVGCLKALLKITELKDKDDVNKDEMRSILEKLIKLDELRKGRYEDYLRQYE